MSLEGRSEGGDLIVQTRVVVSQAVNMLEKMLEMNFTNADLNAQLNILFMPIAWKYKIDPAL